MVPNDRKLNNPCCTPRKNIAMLPKINSQLTSASGNVFVVGTLRSFL